MCRLGLVELRVLVINGQEKRFHYAGMSGEGGGKEPAPLPAPASPAALIDVPAPQQRLGLAEGGPSTTHPSWSQASSQMFLAFGELGWGQGRLPRCQASTSSFFWAGSGAQVASVLLLTFGQRPVSLYHDC